MFGLFSQKTPAQRIREMRERYEALGFSLRQLQVQPYHNHEQWERRTNRIAVVSREMGDLLRDIQSLEETERTRSRKTTTVKG